MRTIVKISNNNLKLIFDAEKGEIVSLTDGIREYVNNTISVFEVAVRNKEGKQIVFDTSEFGFSGGEIKDDSFELSYSGNGNSIKISADISDEIKWKINVVVPEEHVIEWINFPQILVPDDLSEGETGAKILWGFNEGVLVENMDERELEYKYIEPEYPSVSIMGIYPAIVETQFMAYYNSEAGLYFAAHDDMDNLKGIDFYRYENKGIKLQFKHFCGCNFGEKYDLPYPMVMKFFKGGWEDACEIYRNWFKEKRENRFVPKITDNKNLPEWYGESPVIITYPVRGLHDMDEMTPNKLFPYINILPHVERLEKELDSKIMVILMHWEGTAPWAPPYVWPPYGGEDEFKKLVDSLHERGDVIGVYCSGFGWTMKSNVAEYDMTEYFEENNLRKYMCLSPQQELLYSKICTAQRKGYDMCPTQDFTQNVIKDQVEKIASSGVDYIQLLDQNHGGTSYFCYSREHGHPPVPGKWQVDSVKELMSGISEKYKDVLFGCESAAAESYIPYLLFSDNRSNINYMIGRQVPAYAYVFHEYLNNFMGNQVCTNFWLDHERSPINMLERIAYSFSAGDMLTLVLNQDGDIHWNWGNLFGMEIPEQESVKQFVRNSNYWRKEYRKYLHSGKMVKPLSIECGVNIIYRTGDKTPILRSEIYTSAWESADGGFAQLLINYNDVEKDCTVHLDEGMYMLNEYGGNSYELSGGTINLKIKKLSSVLIEKI